MPGLTDALTQVTYPSGRQVNHNYGTDGKLATVSSRVAKNRPFKAYAQAFSYNAAGGVTAMQLGNMRWESTTFNTRLQPTKIALGTTAGDDDMLNLVYTYGTSGASYHDNNGNVLTQTITVDNVGANPGFVAVQSYTYDELNRVKSATENSTPNGGSSAPSWKQTYLYDRFGNRTFDTSGTNTTTLPSSFNANIYNPTINPANNQFIIGQDYDYDPAGNVVEDATGKKFSFDGENKQTSFGTSGSLNNGGTYFYDGDGRRIKKIFGTEVTVFVYRAGGQMVAEYATTAPASPQVSYLTADLLGTPRVNTDAAGSVTARHDYMPFGEEISNAGNRGTAVGYGSDNIDQKFTAKERDTETGLDYFHARYYSNTHGRFTTADPIMMTPSRLVNPQLINRFTYAANNPFAYIDPTGEENIQLGNASEKAIQEELKKKKDARRASPKDAKIQSEVNALETRLSAVQQGNKVVGAWLTQMQNRGEDRGMQVSDFMLSTDPGNDLAKATREANPELTDEKKSEMEAGIDAAGYSGAQPPVGATIGGKMYILSTSILFRATLAGGALALDGTSVGVDDISTVGGTFLRHEKDHKNGERSEAATYGNQLRLIESINSSSKPFANQRYFNDVKNGIQNLQNEAKKSEGIK